jgi:hypothetical protein
MATDPFTIAGTQSVDLTGLPEGVAQGIKQLVRALKEGQAGHASGPTPANASPQEEPLVISRPRPSAEEVDRLLDELSSGPSLKALSADFSRADLYDDHD